MKIVVFGIGFLFAIMLIVYKALYIDIKSGEALSTQHAETEMNISNVSVVSENNEKNVPIQLKKMVLLDDVLENIEKIYTSKNQNDIQEYSNIINWVEGITQEIKVKTGKDYTHVVQQIKNKKVFQVSEDTFSTDPNLRLDDDGSINSIENAFLLVIGDCEVTTPQNSIVFCTANVDIAHSENNIIVSGKDVDIAHDGMNTFAEDNTHDYIGSIIYSKKNIYVSHSYKSTFLYAKNIDVAHVNQSSCINTGFFKASHGVCQNYTVERKENYTDRMFKLLQGKVYPIKKLDKNIYQTSNNPTSIAEEFCYSIKQQEFEISKMLIDPSEMEKFEKDIQVAFLGKHKEEAIRKVAKWSCRVSDMKYEGNEAVGRINGTKTLELKKINGLWKVSHSLRQSSE